MADLPSNTCGNGHGGADKGNREGETRYSGARASAGASRGEGEVGGGGPTDGDHKVAAPPLCGLNFDTEF